MSQPTDYKGTGARVDPSTGDGLDRDRAYDSGFKNQIPEGDQPEYQHKGGVGADRPSSDQAASGSANQKRGAEMGDRAGNGMRGIFAGIHGAGEMLRGGLNSAVDRGFGTDEGATRNDAVSKAGQEEFQAGRFTHDTQGGWGKK